MSLGAVLIVRPVRAGLASSAFVLALVLALGLALASCSGTGRAEEPAPTVSEALGQTRLVLIIAVDQLRRDRLDATMPGGLGRLAREGRVFREATLMHARTETCPGHVSMVTGRHPGPSGVPGNRYIHRQQLRAVYCVADPGPRGVLLGSFVDPDPKRGRSPRLITATAIGDWLKAHSPGSRVYAISPKDRSAIALGGQRADGAFWLDRDGSGGITTSRWYMDALPNWVARWTATALLAPLPEQWTHATGDPENGARRDDFEGEVTRFSRTSPHPVKPHGDDARSLGAFVMTPHLDARTLDFARELVVQEQLGGRSAVDLLAIGLSGTDYIGHLYGPWSQESRDALHRLDADLGDFLDFLDDQLGEGRMLVVLSADHGVLPLPEWLAHEGETCPVAGGRVPAEALGLELQAMLDSAFGSAAGSGSGSGSESGEGRWFVKEGITLVFDPARLAAANVSADVVIEKSAKWLSSQPGVAHAWTRSEIEASQPGDAKASLYRNSTAPGRESDIVIEPASGCLFSDWPGGTSHGSPHSYDRDVPLVFMGAGVEAGEIGGPAATVDIAPTLAARLGVEVPEGVDGRVLPLARQR